MELSKQYKHYLEKSVKDIYQKLLSSSAIRVISYNTIKNKKTQIIISILGPFNPTLVINFPNQTLTKISNYFQKKSLPRLGDNEYFDIAGEISNMIVSNFAQKIHPDKKFFRITIPKELKDNFIKKHLYTDLPFSFESEYGKMNIVIYYKEFKLL